jgi:hypothetical protein
VAPPVPVEPPAAQPPCMAYGVVVPPCGCEVQWKEDEELNRRQPHCDQQYKAQCSPECLCAVLAESDPECKQRDKFNDTCKNCRRPRRRRSVTVPQPPAFSQPPAKSQP